MILGVDDRIRKLPDGCKYGSVRGSVGGRYIARAVANNGKISMEILGRVVLSVFLEGIIPKYKATGMKYSKMHLNINRNITLNYSYYFCNNIYKHITNLHMPSYYV